MKKEMYEAPEVEIIEFATEDIIVASEPAGGDTDENEAELLGISLL